jgi:glycosyltransferase involved in cell wall biosynthesis
MRAKVVLLTTNLARGGAETQVARLAIALRARGWPVSVISLIRPTAFGRELLSAGVPVHSLDMQPGSANPAGLAKLLRLLREIRPEILHSHLFHANSLARAARLVYPAPVVISTLHSVAESGHRSGQCRLRGFVYRLTDPLADVTVAVCQAAAERHAAARAVPRLKLRVIPNGVDCNEFLPGEGGPRGEFTWLAAGRLMWKKDYPTMLRAFAWLGRGVLLIAGEGPEEDALRGLAGANVRFLGARDDIAALMRACDAFVLSSVVEGLPMVLLEAAASGLPCVATDVGGVREIVLDGHTGFVVPPGDPAALAAAMSRLMGMPAEERRRMGEAARAQAVAHFDMDNVVAQWEAMYQAVGADRA